MLKVKGKATDVIDAITHLTVAETNLYRSQYELLRAEAGLMSAMGGTFWRYTNNRMEESVTP
jgi:outer membrane protein TolC